MLAAVERGALPSEREALMLIEGLAERKRVEECLAMVSWLRSWFPALAQPAALLGRPAKADDRTHTTAVSPERSSGAPGSGKPELIVNRQLALDLVENEHTNCATFGAIGYGGKTLGLLALRTELPLPSAFSQPGFRLGHELLGYRGRATLAVFTIEFYNWKNYSLLVNPSDPTFRRVAERIAMDRIFFIMHVGPCGQSVTVFGGDESIEASADHIAESLPLIKRARATKGGFESARTAFYSSRPPHAGTPLEWLPERPGYLDPDGDPLVLDQ